MKKILNKCKKNQGFTLVEMLATVIVMLLVTEIITLSIQMSAKYYVESVRNSESQTICGTLAAAVQEELQYATKIQTAPGSTADEAGNYADFTYYSRARQHGSNCTLVCKDDGKLYVRKGENDYALVGSETYTYDLKAEMECTWNKNDRYFDVSIAILSGTQRLAEQSFRVNPLNEGF